MTITFVCLNLWPIADLFPEIIQFLRSVRPDVLAIQEVYAGTDPNLPAKFRAFSELKQQLNLPYGEFAPAFLEAFPDKKIEQGNAVISRFPIQAKKTVFFDYPHRERLGGDQSEFETTPRNLQHVEILLKESEKESKSLQVFNTQGIWGVDGADSERRLAMSQIIVQQVLPEVENGSSTILAGDFNIQPNTQTIKAIEAHLKNIFKDELKTTFNMKQKTNPGYASAVVDMIFVSPNLKILDHSCPSVDISDHLPLIARLEI
jgi:endonuclease/exonuclease/phosphatase family metal-dependent hydrolase